MVPNQPITQLITAGRPLISVEFFPPKDTSSEAFLHNTIADLECEGVRQPDFVSITYGAGGSTQERTLRYACMLKERYGLQVMPHLTCVGASRRDLDAVLTRYWEAGFRNIMTLRGDPPGGAQDFVPAPDGFSHADELVQFIHERFPDQCLGVAGYPEKHPEAASFEEDVRHLREKVEAGAEFITTQLFYDNACFFRFVERCRQAGIMVPIFPGLMPVVSLEQTQRFCSLCHASLPPTLEDRLQKARDSEAVQQVGIDWACEQIESLLHHDVPGIHLYTLNRSASAKALVQKFWPGKTYAG